MRWRARCHNAWSRCSWRPAARARSWGSEPIWCRSILALSEPKLKENEPLDALGTVQSGRWMGVLSGTSSMMRALSGNADFYYGEMEMRRRDRDATPAGERALLWVYWLISGCHDRQAEKRRRVRRAGPAAGRQQKAQGRGGWSWPVSAAFVRELCFSNTLLETPAQHQRSGCGPAGPPTRWSGSW
jgi:hypothetical protein